MLATLIESHGSLGLDRAADPIKERGRAATRREKRQRARSVRRNAFLQFNIPYLTVGLVAATAKTVASVQAAANQVVKILGLKISHDGATSTAAPDITDYNRCTFGAAGTGTSVTPSKNDPGRAETIQSTALKAYSVEPTTQSSYDEQNVPLYNGLLWALTPSDRPIIVVGGQGFVIRCTAQATANATGAMLCEE
jgi:hypothetical protein